MLEGRHHRMTGHGQIGTRDARQRFRRVRCTDAARVRAYEWVWVAKALRQGDLNRRSLPIVGAFRPSRSQTVSAARIVHRSTSEEGLFAMTELAFNQAMAEDHSTAEAP